jgi:flavin-dependent dehydrogenase
MSPIEPADGTRTGLDCDVLVIGGGPAGSTVAALLAERGRRVVLLEKDRHPRFHIGESLLPQNLPLLDRLGVRAQIEMTAQHKHGIEFVSPVHGKSMRFEFANAWDKRFPYSFQVRRSAFDETLLRNAAAKGAEVIEQCRVTAVEFAEDGPPLVYARGADGMARHWRPAFVVDATGRDTLLANQMGTKERNKRNDSAAIFAHFTGARRLEGQAEGNITIVWFDNGWFWFIPLADGTTSVGAVSPAAAFKNRGTDLAGFFRGLIASSPEIADRLKHATLVGEVQATGNYSYASKVMSGRHYVMAGDACSFIDPVFSAGVFLAMTTGFWAAETVETCLATPARAARALKRYDARAYKALNAFSWFVYRIREPAMRDLFMAPRNIFRMEEAVLSLLAGGIGDGWQVKLRLYLFRAVYYLSKLAYLRPRAVAAAPAAGTPHEVRG